jgi:hypothetical protein
MQLPMGVTMSFLDEYLQYQCDTINKARAFNGCVTDLCKEVGVSSRWFYGFKRGEYKMSRVDRIQRLNDAIDRLQQA